MGSWPATTGAGLVGSVLGCAISGVVLKLLTGGVDIGEGELRKRWSGPSPLYAYQAPIAPSVPTKAIGIFGRRMEACRGCREVEYLLTREEEEEIEEATTWFEAE